MGILENKARARLFYKYFSELYDTVNPFIWNEEMRDEALEWFGVEAGDEVLDVGCGTGFATEGLLGYTERVHGLDQSDGQLSKAFAKFGKRGGVKFYRGDAERLPFKNDTFDALWSSGSIEYWPNPVAALEEFRRVVEPGGPVLVVGPDYPERGVFQKLADAIMLFYDEEEADRMFERAGYEEFSHRIQQRKPGTPRAITTLAYVPEDEEGEGREAESRVETEAEAGTEAETGTEADDPVEA
jgi:demethylmenaquinone methyltransferase/2-methoxy-6-polyprenyl-1,4-benzoquinol methylase